MVPFMFIQKDLKPLFLFLSHLKICLIVYIYKKNVGGDIILTDGNYHNLKIDRLSELRSLVLLINGCFRTPKIEALHRLILWLNNRKSLLNKMPIPLLPMSTTDLGDNAWLTGYIEADGGFQIGIRLKPGRKIHTPLRSLEA